MVNIISIPVDILSYGALMGNSTIDKKHNRRPYGMGSSSRGGLRRLFIIFFLLSFLALSSAQLESYTISKNWITQNGTSKNEEGLALIDYGPGSACFGVGFTMGGLGADSHLVFTFLQSALLFLSYSLYEH